MSQYRWCDSVVTFTAQKEAPNSIRSKFGTDQTANAVHGSDSNESAVKEISFYFGNSERGSSTATFNTTCDYCTNLLIL